MLKQIALSAALLATLGTTHAYQAEINAGYENTDIENLGDLDTIFINGKYYLNGVQVKNTPLAEAAFLSKASNIGLGYANASGDGDEDIDALGINGEFFIPNTQFYVSAALNQTDFGDEDNTGYAFEVGYLPIEGLLLAVGAANENVDPVQVANYGFTANLLNAVTVGEDTALSLRAKYVTLIGNHYANFEGISYMGDETTYRLGADLYIDPTLSVGVSIADSTADESDTLFGVRAQKFFTPAIAAGLNYTTTDGADSFGINGTFRF